MGSVQEMAVEITLGAAKTVAANLQGMPADKQTWQPLDMGRTALSQVQECAVMNRFFTATLRDRQAPELAWEQYKAECAALETADKAIEALHASTEEFVGVAAAVPDGTLQDRISMPFAEGLTMSVREVMFSPYWNMTYHQGQIAYIQTLYGDREMYGMG